MCRGVFNLSRCNMRGFARTVHTSKHLFFFPPHLYRIITAITCQTQRARRPDRHCEFCHNRFVDCNNVCPAVAAAAATVLCKEEKKNNALIRTNTTTCAVLLQCSATGDTSSALLSSCLQGKSVIVKNRDVSHLYTLRLVMHARTIIIRSP